MSFWVTEEVMRRGLRLCSRRSLWQKRRFLVTASIKDTYFPSQQLAHIWATRQSQMCVARASSVRFHSEEKGHPSPPLAESWQPTEIQSDETASTQSQESSSFSHRLQLCGSPSDVLDLICQYSPSAGQLSNSLIRMRFITKMMSERQRQYELQLMFEHPAFEKLMQMVMTNVKYMCTEEVAYSLLAMVKLGVPQRSRVVQTFLRNCQEKLNDFDEKGLSILASSLEIMEDGPNVDVLKQGIRMMAEARLPKIKNVIALQTLMRLIGKDSPQYLKQKLEAKALSMTDQFSLPNTQYMVITMATMDFSSRPLLKFCSQKIKEDLHEIPFNKLLTILQCYRELKYRDLDLFTAFSHYGAAAIDIWNPKQVILFLSSLEKLTFCPTVLMETYAGRVIANPDFLTLKSLLSVLKVYASLNCDLQHQRQQFLDSLSQALDPYLPKMPGYQLLQAVYYLCLLGHFPSAPLEQLLQSSTLEQLLQSTAPLIYKQQKMFQMVNACLHVDRPSLPLPLTVPPSVLGDPAPSSPPVKLWLSQGLQDVLRDQADTVLQEMVVVENFHLVDAVITKPLPNQTSVAEASSCAGEACSPAESSQRVAVICAGKSSFCYGTVNPCGPLAVKLRHLKILGYKPVVVVAQELQFASVEGRAELLRGLIFPEHLKSDSQPKTEQLES